MKFNILENGTRHLRIITKGNDILWFRNPSGLVVSLYSSSSSSKWCPQLRLQITLLQYIPI